MSRRRLDQRHDQRHDQAGAVTAETAVALPVIVLFALSMAWLVGIGAVQIRAIDAARETARAVARGDGAGEAVSLGRRVAGEGSAVEVEESGEIVVVTVTSPVSGPAGLFGAWSGFRVRAQAVAAQEPRS